jgi:beta-galactosidase
LAFLQRRVRAGGADVPHDWSVEGAFAAANPTGAPGGFLPAGTGWYRKHFKLPDTDAQRRVFIQLEGVMANSDVWINGFHLGHRPFGYVELDYELTGHLKFDGADNVLAVKADNSVQPASRFYAGAGIYRHVYLISTDPVHLENHGVYVTDPELTDEQARVRVESAVTNSTTAPGEVTVRVTLAGPDGQTAATGETKAVVAAGQEAVVKQDLVVPHPQRWDLDSPKLYHATSEVRAGDKTVDDQTVAFGLRDAKFVPETGFWLNGKNFKIKGVCVHQDGGAFGAAVPMSVWERRLLTLKAVGVNAVRTAHNPPAPEFLDLCDRVGMLVMDEMFDCWLVGKSGSDGRRLADYHLDFAEWSLIDERDTARRDRNHPSIILYSTGNEIHDTPNAESARKILTGLVATFHEYDPGRPVTQALFRPNASHDYTDGLADLLDVVGQNYRENEILAARQQVPTRKIVGTENGLTRQTWVALRDHPDYSGQFLWSGLDYLGESPGWPDISRPTGLLDRTGVPRAEGYEWQSWWSDRPMVYVTRRVAASTVLPTDPGYSQTTKYRQVLFSDWTVRTPAEQGEDVEVYSNCREVELLLNGQSLGAKPLPRDASPRTWRVPFVPGTLKAVGKNDGGIAATYELKTAGPAAKIVLNNDRPTLAPGWDEVALVRATVVDAQGVPVPTANDLITFKTTGPGMLAAVDNVSIAAEVDNPPGIVSFQNPRCHAAGGPVVAFVKATADRGAITLTASAPGLTGDAVTIQVRK